MKSISRFLVLVIAAVMALGSFVAVLNGQSKGLEFANQMLEQRLLEYSDLVARLCRTNMDSDSHLFEQTVIYQCYKNDVLLHASDRDLMEFDGLPAGFHFVTLDGVRWRVHVHDGPVGDNEYRWIVGLHNDAYLDGLEQMIISVAEPILFVIPIIALLIWWLVRLGMSPLYQIADELRKRHGDDFSPMRSESYPQELSQVVISLNQLLTRLQGAFSRERQVASYAAHELRSPLTSMNISLHNLRRADLSRDEQRRSLENLQLSTEGMIARLEQLLYLARLPQTELSDNAADFNLDTVVLDAISETYHEIEAAGQDIEFNGAEVNMWGDASAIAVLVRNLLENAVKYGGKQGRILVSTGVESNKARLCIEDSGPGIPTSERDKVLERFYRIGGDRHNSSIRGSGLGLSIVHHIASLHNSALLLDQSPTLGGLRVRLDFALAEDDE